MSKKLAAYQYEGISSPRFVFASWLEHLPWNFFLVVIGLIAAYYLIGPDSMQGKNLNGLIFTCAGALLLYLLFVSKGPGLIVTADYFTYNEKIYFFENLSSIHVNEQTRALKITHKQGKSITLSYELFKTNARKPEKQEKNRTEKFFKVADKLIASAQRRNPELELDIESPNRLANYLNGEGA